MTNDLNLSKNTACGPHCGYGMPPWMPTGLLAVHEGHIVVARALQNAKFDVETRDARGMTGLHVAAQAGQADMARILLLAGANCNSRDSRGRTPAHYSAMAGHAEITAILLSARADPNACTDAGFYVLHRAALFGHLEVVKILLAAGADPNARDVKQATPLYAAAQNGHASVVLELVIEDADVEAKTKQGFTPLHVAARRGHLAVMSILLDAGASVTTPTSSNATSPLHVAAGFSRSACVEELLRRGADPTVPDCRGASAVDMVGSLIAHRIMHDDNEPGTSMEEDESRTREALRRESTWRRRRWVLMLRSIMDAQRKEMRSTAFVWDISQAGKFTGMGARVPLVSLWKRRRLEGCCGIVGEEEGVGKSSSVALDADSPTSSQGFMGMAVEAATEGNEARVVKEELQEICAEAKDVGGIFEATEWLCNLPEDALFREVVSYL